MKEFWKIQFVALAILIAMASCITHSKLTYLQLAEALTDTIRQISDTIVPVTPSAYKIKPFDNIYIRVVTPDPQWSDMFNTIPTTAVITISEQSAQLLSYPVDVDGTIKLPYAGKLLVAGKTLSEIQEDLEKLLRNYVTDAAVSVKMVNNYVSVIGEVRLPGRYPIYKDRMNIFEAVALAGDLSEYSDRQKLQVIRSTEKGNAIREFSLASRDIMSSELFYVMPNDVIYVQPMKGKFFQMNAFPYSVILSSITTFILIFNYIRPAGAN